MSIQKLVHAYLRQHYSYIIAKKWKGLICLSTDEWINKVWYIYTMEYYSAIKRGEALTLDTMQMNLENMMLSVVKQSQRSTYCMIPFG